MKPILSINNLTVSIGAKRVMDGVCLDLYKGEIAALLGESGSGKTMTALSVLRLLPEGSEVVSGSIDFDGRALMDMTGDEVRGVRGSGISMAHQEPFTALNPVIRAGDQIREVLIAHKVCPKEAIEGRIGELLDMVKLKHDVSSRFPHELSGGQRQRVMVAMAISAGPDILILDEPTTALDVSVQKHILDLVVELQDKEGFAVLFITHDFSVVNMVADKVYVMKDGKVVESGTKEDVLKRPEHPYTKQLIECVPKLGDTRSRLPYRGVL